MNSMSLKSMEGYGKGEASNSDVGITVEIRSSANRFREVQIKLPQAYLSLERQIKKMISEHIVRGKIEVFIRRHNIKSQTQIHINLELAEQYYQAMATVAKRLQREATDIDLQVIMDKPGVLMLTEIDPDPQQEWLIVSTAVESALRDVLQQRSQHGKIIEQDLQEHLRAFQEIRNLLCSQIDDINASLQERLEKRLQKLLSGQIHPNRLSQEAALLVEKSDISEELLRLEQYSIDLGTLPHSSPAVGRQMDILLQEINRDLNIIASKVIDVQSAQLTVQLKQRLEKIRELISQTE